MLKTVADFLNKDSAGGLLLMLSASLALIVANSPLAESYESWRSLPVSVVFGDWAISKPLLLWINDGLMAIFFLLVGLELKRELLIGQICAGGTSYRGIKDRAVMPVLREWVAPEQLYYLETYAPETLELPRRKRPVRLRYEADGRVFVASKLQDFYDVKGESLRLANGQVAPVVELLAPSGRPAHVTDDLDGFWSGAYVHVRKELAGRYPKHEWR